jgi:oligopeptide/dipeptide ABC transporter ATP-binding protein
MDAFGQVTAAPAAPEKALLRVEGLGIELRLRGLGPVRVVEDVGFSIAPGEALALVGESGSGKSLIAMGSLDLLPVGARVVAGRTTFAGRVLQELEAADWRRLVGMGVGVLFQDPVGSWDPTMAIGPQSGEVLDAHEDLPRDEIRRRVTAALGEVGLANRHRFGLFAHQLSRGQAQRAMLAATLLSAPQILVADEPLSGLDPTVARAVLDLLDDMRRRRSMALLLVTHDLGVVAAVADRVAVVYGGMIVEEGPARRIYQTPQHPYTRGLLNSIPGRQAGRLRPIPGEPPVLWDLPPGCPFAPRCGFAIEDCGSRRPGAVSVAGVLVACVRAGDDELGASVA